MTKNDLYQYNFENIYINWLSQVLKNPKIKAFRFNIFNFLVIQLHFQKLYLINIYSRIIIYGNKANTLTQTNQIKILYHQ